MDFQVSDLALSEFFAECEELTQRITVNLAHLEKRSTTPEVLDELYRDVHTLKGSAQLFGFKAVGKIAHAMEASLSPVRRKGCLVGAPLIDGLYGCLDLMGRMIRAAHDKSPECNSDEKTPESVVIEENAVLSRLIAAATAQFGGDYLVYNDPIGGRERDLAIEPIPEAKPVTKQIIEESETPKVAANVSVSALPPAPAPVVPEESAAGVSASADTTIRVQVGLLDRLMNLVAELVLVRNQVLQYSNKNENLEFLNLSQSLDGVTSELQSEVMRTRMQPIGGVLSKFQRVIRDLAKSLNKKIDLTVQGAETELDKTLLEAVKDPLTHIIRNSCDHGIETIEERIAAKKPETGHLMVRAFHEGGQVVVEVSDDGKGLDRHRILAKAIEKGLVPADKASQLSDRDVFNLIFAPGLSTAKNVTSVSGRGVGMDVVKTNIGKIGGTVDVNSMPGRGTTIRLKIPLTLAIVPAMIVRSGVDKYAIPQVKLVELVRVDASKNADRIEYLQGKPMYRLRGDLLQLVRIEEVLGQKPRESREAEFEITNIVVLTMEGGNFGLIVDEILDTADIVVKPLSSFLKSLSIFSGATIMGDGSIALILDVTGIAQLAKVDSKVQASDEAFLGLSRSKVAKNTDAQDFLLFSLANKSTHAIPLCFVHRLEEFASAQIEFSGEQMVIRYRESILPLITLNESLNYKKDLELQIAPDATISVIVVQKSGKSYGIIVDEILDVILIDDPIDDSIRDRAGILGNVIFNNEIVVVVDALSVIDHQASTNRGSAIQEIREKSKEMHRKKVRILFAEDVAFFRRHVAKVLTDAGHEVTVVEDGAKAMKALDAAATGDFNLLLTDIEMPVMGGLELAREVRKSERFSALPLIAITTRFKDRDIEDGKIAGFNLYLEKLNAEKLLDSIESIMAPVASAERAKS